MATENFCMSFDDRSNCNFLNFSVRYPYPRKVKKIALMINLQYVLEKVDNGTRQNLLHGKRRASLQINQEKT